MRGRGSALIDTQCGENLSGYVKMNIFCEVRLERGECSGKMNRLFQVLVPNWQLGVGSSQSSSYLDTVLVSGNSEGWRCLSMQKPLKRLIFSQLRTHFPSIIIEKKNSFISQTHGWGRGIGWRQARLQWWWNVVTGKKMIWLLPRFLSESLLGRLLSWGIDSLIPILSATVQTDHRGLRRPAARISTV